MYQIDNSTVAATQPAPTGAGTSGFFTDGNPATGTPATVVPAEWLNAVMMELANAVTAAGLTLNKASFNQLTTAIKLLAKQPTILADSGAANAYTAVNSTPLVSGTWVDGVSQRVKIANTNTGASTYSPDGLAAIPIYGLGLQPLQGGELLAGGTAALVRATIASVNSGNPICVLVDCQGGAQQVPNGTQSQHAGTLAQTISAAGAACRLVYSGGNLVLNRYRGLYAYIPGSGIVAIPSGGITLAPSGLTASTLYYIYLTAAGALMASTTGHTTDSNTGIEVMSGDNTKLFVGMEYASGTTTWAGLCRSWFNDPGMFLVTPLTSSTVVNGNVIGVEVSSALRIAFLAFQNEPVFAYADGTLVPNVANQTPSSGIGFDGTTPEETIGGGTQPYQANPNLSFNVSVHKTGLSEGYHYATLLGNVPGSFSCTWVGNGTKGNRSSMKVFIGSRK
ncbi:hypothetical protein [Cupriavidus basilensis]|uniref:hypothetical protein n=1 Tax=Cupriavidus basilensis TaxID=68895 RepID=UPI0020A64959|nr:hypothetical protein [Cupriavidus basilensis]MCP3017952.1 hypothetical protein [Cupriavidus basilensis]